ncbi:MAG: DUF1236 domain-containing protein [Devosia sp.]|jgi:uncharacterized protein YcfJ
MRKLLAASMAVLSLAMVAPAFADDAAAGGTAGAVAGATAGFFIAGPIGAAVGGAIGAGTGATIAASDEDYVRHHRVASIHYDGDVKVGYRVGHGLHVYAIPEDPKYSYVYVDDRPVLIDNDSQTVVWIGD